MFRNFFQKSWSLWDNVERYCTAGQATDYNNMAHTHCILDPKVCKHPLRFCNTRCFSSITKVARTSLNVLLFRLSSCIFVD